MPNDTEDLAAFALTFKRFLDDVIESVPARPPEFEPMLREHFGQPPGTLPVVTESLQPYQHADLQAALDAFLAAERRTFHLEGVTNPESHGDSVSLALLLCNSALRRGPVQYAHVASGPDSSVACVQRGLYLVSEGETRCAILVHARSDWRRELVVEVMARSAPDAERVLADVRVQMRARSVFRGKVLSLAETPMRELTVHHHRVPEVRPEQLILPEGLHDRIERNTVTFMHRSEALARAGRHLKRGILLYGPPGTGKTLTAMYLASRMPGRTVLLLSGRGLGLLEASCAMARALQPSTVIVEDVDLVAEERTRQNNCNTPLLFELLNQMDGIAEDADVLFVLTTNRPDILEPALAARPGRVDQAIEVPLPDAECRRRLIDLYARGLTLRAESVNTIVDRTAGASAAFMRELLRRAALIASDEDGPTVVEDRHLDEALHELVVAGGALTRSLLGATELKPS
jgi:ATP-dependent 26S proteasome regulatory subunit